MENFLRDVRYAAHRLIKQPVITAVTVLTLTLGIGANTVMFSIVDAAMLRPLPYPDSDHLAHVLHGRSRPGEPATVPQVWWSYPKFELLRSSTTIFESLAAYAVTPFNLTGITQPRRIETEIVSQAYFSVLGISAIRGRVFSADEDVLPESARVALISHSLWQGQFGSDPDILGVAIEINEVPLTIVGVMPRRFRGLSGTAELWIPMMMAPVVQRRPEALTWWGTHWHRIVGRFSDGVSMATAAAELETLGVSLDERFPSPGDATTRVVPSPLSASRTDANTRRSMLVLLGAVGFVLLIACINVGGLLVGRASDRSKEMAIRTALGSSRARIAGQLLLESVMMSVAGGTLGVAVAYGAQGALMGVLPTFDTLHLFQVYDIYLSGRVLLFTLAIAVLSGMLFGTAPALQVSRPRLTSMLSGNLRSAVTLDTHRSVSWRHTLIVAQFAVATLLLSGAGLMVKSLAGLRSIDGGFDARDVLTLRLQPNVAEPQSDHLLAFKTELLRAIESLPGVHAASVSNCTPLSGRCWRTIVTGVEDHRVDSSEPIPIGVQYVGASHFRAMGIPVVMGRTFSDDDRKGAPPVLILNQTAARTLWPGEDPIGKRMRIGEPLFNDGQRGEVIGVVADVKYDHASLPTQPDAYLSALQGGPAGLVLMVRSDRPVTNLMPEVRDVVLALDHNLPVYDVMTMNERVAAASADSRFNTILLSVFSGLGLLLAAIGLYGALAYQVSRHTREIGLRLALGAAESRVMRWILRRGVGLSVLGIGVGLTTSVGAMRVIDNLLYDVSPHDPVTLFGVATLLLVVAALATYLPARRATRVDPVMALKE